MKLFKVTLECEVKYVLADGLKALETEYPESSIHIIELLSSTVVNLTTEVETVWSPAKLLRYFCHVNEIHSNELLSASRLKHFVAARRAVAYLCRHELQMTYNEIGNLLNREHTSIVAAVERAQEDLDRRRGLAYEYYTRFKKHYN